MEKDSNDSYETISEKSESDEQNESVTIEYLTS